VKGFKAKGKRLTTFALAEVIELEPTRFPEPEDDNDDDDDDGGGDNGDGGDGGAGGDDADDAPREKSDDEIRDELTGQLRLF
jgi:topoisomerase-4 subunit A